MFYKKLIAYLFIHLALGVISGLLFQLNPDTILFYLLTVLLFNGFIANLIPFQNATKIEIVLEMIAQNTPYIIISIVLSVLIKPSIAFDDVFCSLLALIVSNLMLQGFFAFFNSFSLLPISQALTSLFFLILTTGVLLVPSFTSILNNYNQKNDVYQFFAQINPIIVICNAFDIDPFHKEQLYLLFGSSYLVPKTDVFRSIALWGGVAVFFWLIYLFWFQKYQIQKNTAKLVETTEED